MRNFTYRSFLKGLLVLCLGSLVAACSTDSMKHGSSRGEDSTATAAACSGNAYLQKYGCSMRRINEAARSGDPDAEYALGYMYYYGIGTARDRQAAKSWIGRAARQGQPLAKKAEVLMNDGNNLHSLHGNPYASARGGSGSEDTADARKTTPKFRKANVDELNTATPDKPLNEVLPNYGKKKAETGKPESVIKSLQKKTIPAANDSDPSDLDPSKVEPITQLKDPRLLPGAKPNSTTARRAMRRTRKMAHKTTTTTSATGTTMSATEREMMEVSRKHYTLQIMGGRNLAAVKTFVRTHDLGGKAYIYSTKMKGKPWYMLVYGDYPTMKQAHVATQQMPLALRSMHPWAKSYRIVHDEIRLRRIVS